MERKRPLESMDVSFETGRPPKTPRKNGEFQIALDALCSSARVSLGSSTDAKSPEVKIKKNFNFLFFQGDDALLHRLQHEAVDSVPTGATSKARAEHLDQFLRREAERLNSDRKADAAKKALTLTEKFRATQGPVRVSPVASRSPALVQSTLNFAVAKPHNSAVAKPHNFAVANPQQDRPAPAAERSSFTASSRNTSFNTTGVNTSFWSSRASPPPGTADTILDSSDESSDGGFEMMADRSSKSELDQPAGLSKLDAKLREVVEQKSEAQQQRPESQVSDYLQSSLDSNDLHLLDAKCQSRTIIGRDFAQLEILADSPFNSENFPLQWEIQRVLQNLRQRKHYNNPSLALHENWKQPHSLTSLYESASRMGLPFVRTFPDPAAINFSDLSLSAKLEWTKNDSGLPLFNMILCTQSHKQEKTCELQRSHGSENVLYLDMPSLSKPGRHQNGLRIKDRFKQTFSRPVEILGRRWVLYNLQEPKRKKSAKNPDENQGIQYKLILLALEPLSVKGIYRYFVDLEMNKDSLACKLYSRTNLQASRTTPTITLTPDMIDYGVEDMHPTPDPDDLDFMDPKLRAYHRESEDITAAMNDGCSVISPWLARSIMKAMGDDQGHDRRAWQFRVCGAKGVVVCHSDPFQSDNDTLPGGKHMQISESQQKVVWSTLNDCDPRSLTLNIVQSNMRARNSVLHTGFLPILIDRGVTADAIYKVVRTQQEQKSREVIQALADGPIAIRLWLASQNSYVEETNRDKGVIKIAGFPINRVERMKHLLESGFDPREHEFLAKELKETMSDIFNHEKQNFRIPLGRSTTLMGVADMHDCLKPGEIYVRFSQPLKDPVSGDSWTMLDGKEVLVARNPAMGPWDIQKVKCVYRQKLAYLTDTIVFASRGTRSLASKLSGGDYDGDTFWICWDPALASPFQNAPVPASPVEPKSLGIKKRTELLRDYVQDPSSEGQWCDYSCDMALKLMEPNLLGTVSLLHERLIYKTGKIGTEEAISLVQLHDCLVDAPKQGYVFTDQDLKAFKKAHKIPSNLPDPWYWNFSRADGAKVETTYAAKKCSVQDNIIDNVFLQGIQPVHERTLDTIRDKLSIDDSIDPHLGKFFVETRNSIEQDSSPNGTWKKEQLVYLKKQILALRGINSGYSKKGHDFQKMMDNLQTLRHALEAIQPTDQLHPTALEWARRQGNSNTIWEKLRASAFAHYRRDMSMSWWLVFSVAGNELCELKANEVSTGVRHIVPEQYDILRPKRKRRDQLARERSFQDVETDAEGMDGVWSDDNDDDL